MTKSQKNSITIRDVARRAGVSVATVSRFINNTVPVSMDVADRVRLAMLELNFTPHAAARMLATMRTNTIGLLLTDIHGDFFVPMLSGIEQVAGEAAYDLLISTSGHPESRKLFPAPIGPHNADGVLIFANSIDQQGLKRYSAQGFPIVLIHQTSPEGMHIPCVTVENKAASRKIVEHLILAHHCRRIVFLKGPQDQEDSQWRELGYRQALEEHHLPIDLELIAQGDFDRKVARESIIRMLQQGVEFDAVFAGDDEAAVGVLSALQEGGKRVPHEVAVVGFDDQRFSTFLTPPLTTVLAPTEEVGRVAALRLLDLIHKKQVDMVSLLPTKIVIRNSCGCSGE
jgi:DNA-binding LacI/PurR family transcriptional regulator